VIGSERKTSSAAPPTLPESRAASRSSSTISGPRATLSTHAVLALGQRLGVEPALGLRRLGQVQGQEVGLGVDLVGGLGLVDAEVAVALGGHEGSKAITRIPKPWARWATSWPMRPKPRIPSVLSSSSTPENCERSQRPAIRLAWAGARCGPAQQQRHRVLGRGDDVGLWRVGDDDAALGRGGTSTLSTPSARARWPSGASRAR
jgi:hypothetical protein